MSYLVLQLVVVVVVLAWRPRRRVTERLARERADMSWAEDFITALHTPESANLIERTELHHEGI